MLIIGIDPCTIPSKTPGGGIAWTGDKGTSCIAMPSTGRDVHKLIGDIVKVERAEGEPVVAYMENIVQFARQEETRVSCPKCKRELTCCNGYVIIKVTPNHQMFTMSKLYGGFKYLEGAFDVRNIPLNTVDARTWQKVVGVKKGFKMPQQDWKNELKAKAKFYYPELEKKITLKTADALLIMRYGWIMENQNKLF